LYRAAFVNLRDAGKRPHVLAVLLEAILRSWMAPVMSWSARKVENGDPQILDLTARQFQIPSESFKALINAHVSHCTVRKIGTFRQAKACPAVLAYPSRTACHLKVHPFAKSSDISPSPTGP
jgi:hypothetical protein